MEELKLVSTLDNKYMNNGVSLRKTINHLRLQQNFLRVRSHKNAYNTGCYAFSDDVSEACMHVYLPLRLSSFFL